MFIYKDLLEDIQAEIFDNSPETEADILRWTNSALRRLCDRYRWQALRDQKTLSPDSDGMVYLPPLCQKKFTLFLTDHTYRFIRTTDDPTVDKVSYYYEPEGVRLNATSTHTASCTESGQTVELSGSPDLSGWSAGDGVSFAGVSGLFEILTVDDTADEITIWPSFPGSTGSYTMSYEPPGQQKLELFQPDGTNYTDDIQVVYYRPHPAIVSDTDIILVDFRESLYFEVLRYALRQEKYTTDEMRLMDDRQEALENDLNNQDENTPPLVSQGMPGHVPTFSTHRRRGSSGSYETERNW